MGLEGKSLKGDFIKFIIPSVLAQWIYTLYTMVDGMFVANGVSEIALTAVNLSFPFIALLFALSLMLLLPDQKSAPHPQRGDDLQKGADVVGAGEDAVRDYPKLCITHENTSASPIPGSIFNTFDRRICAIFNPTAMVITPPQALRSASIPSFTKGRIYEDAPNSSRPTASCGSATKPTRQPAVVPNMAAVKKSITALA